MPFLASRGLSQIPCLVAPSSVFKVHRSALCLCCPISFWPRPSCLPLIRTHCEIQDHLPLSRSWTPPHLQSPFRCKSHSWRFCRLGRRRLWGGAQRERLGPSDGSSRAPLKATLTGPVVAATEAEPGAAPGAPSTQAGRETQNSEGFPRGSPVPTRCTSVRPPAPGHSQDGISVPVSRRRNWGPGTQSPRVTGSWAGEFNPHGEKNP